MREKRRSVKRLVLLGLLGVLFVVSGQPGARGAGGPAPEPVTSPCGNGDVNGDGALDLGDAVYILTYLFAAGEAPVSIDCALPATGQSICYDETGEAIDCTNGVYPGQDGAYRIGCPTGGRFVDNGDGTVTDRCTGLMWQRITASRSGGGGVSAMEDELFTWGEALRYCEDLILCRDGTWTTDPAVASSHGGGKYNDWRLPSVRELQGIVDYGRAGPACDPLFDTRPEAYWSSTSDAADPAGAWAVHFFNGCVEDDATKDLFRFVRAVRTGSDGLNGCR